MLLQDIKGKIKAIQPNPSIIFIVLKQSHINNNEMVIASILTV